MKKHMRPLLVCVILCSAAFAAFLFPNSNNSKDVSAESAAGSSLLQVLYYDDFSTTGIVPSGCYNGTTGFFYISFGTGVSGNPQITGTANNWIIVEYAPGLSRLGEMIDYHEMDSDSYSIETDENQRTIVRIPYTEIGFYLLKVYTKTSSESFVNSYDLTCRNPEPDIYAVFDVNSSNSFIFYNDISEISLSLRQRTDHKYNASIVTGATLEIKDSEGTNVNSWFNISSVTVNGSETLKLAIKDNQDVKNGDYTITFKIRFDFEQLDLLGVKTSELREVEVPSLTFSFADRPSYNFPWLTVILGIVVVGVLGGGLYLSSWLVKYSQEPHPPKGGQ